MKKNVVILIMVCLLLCGCGSNGGVKNEIDLQATSKELDKKYGNMVEMNNDELSAIYGLDTSEISEYVIKSSEANDGSLYAILKVDADNRTSVKNQMDNMFKVLENQSNLYSPDAVKLLKNRLETSMGDYLIYIVSNDNDSMYNVIKDAVN